MKVNPTQAVNELITALAYIIDIEKKRNIYHAWRVAILASRIIHESCQPQEKKDIFYASLLHDIAGVGFPFHIIHYLKRSDKNSKNILLSHPIIGADLVYSIPQMHNAAKLILDHHEWINGAGYPRAKTKKDIPRLAQAIRLADAIDIHLHNGRIRQISDLKNIMRLNINKEYAQGLYTLAFAQLKKENFFYRALNSDTLPRVFQEIKEAAGPIRIQSGIDAIGTTLEVFAHVIDMKHAFTAGHSLRVSRYAMACALAMKLEHDEITLVKWAGLIHDVGKLIVPRKILDKNGKLSAREFQQVKKHAELTSEIINMLPTLEKIISVALAHHEYFDGNGYPRGLKIKEIPLGSRILAICDAFDAMVSNRPYRAAFTPKDACQEIEKLSGRQFDPEVAKYAIPLFRNLNL